MKHFIVLGTMLACFSCVKNLGPEIAGYQDTLVKIKDKTMRAKLDCEKAMLDYEAGMDREQDERKLQAREIVATRKCIAAFAVAEDFAIENIRLFDESSQKPSERKPGAKKYAEAADYYLWATQSYTELWIQRLKCAALPIEGDLEEDYECAERAESLETRASHLWRHAERTHNALVGIKPAQGGGK